MGAKKSTKTRKNIKTTSRRSEHWKTLPRDKKGRWTKARKKKKSTKKHIKSSSAKSKSVRTQRTVPIKNKASTVKSHTSRTSNISISSQTNNLCPRCGGDMKFHRIRCGPERLVSVTKCEICNFWLPIGK
ncbi:MAG: hypothetical protein K9W44_17485 [Candidatus Lokiarchaeota archaeon]|nr:hypothetical protein [Candidatus Harpocratesius repetitus]